MDSRSEIAGQANVKYPKLSPLKLFAPARPAVALADGGGTMMLASGSDDGGYSSSRGDAGRDDPSLGRSGPRSPRGSSGGGRQRTVQFQPEERYWTEYLRIALPIIGLLLMIGLFWFWAQELINDPANPDQPSATTTPPGVAEVITNESTPEPTKQSLVATDPPQETTEEAAAPTGEPAEETPAGDTPTEEPATDGDAEPTAAADEPASDLAIDSAAVINDSDVNLRPDASTAGEPVATLQPDTTVTIIGGPTDAENYTWWEIVVDETGATGWVAEDFLDPAP